MAPTVLIADDQADLLAILVARFRASGFEVLEARNGAEAMTQASERSPDVVVLDVMMPELNGFQVCRLLKDQRFSGPIVLLTAKDSEADRFWGEEVGADLYLSKPINPAQVVERVQRLLGPSE